MLGNTSERKGGHEGFGRTVKHGVELTSGCGEVDFDWQRTATANQATLNLLWNQDISQLMTYQHTTLHFSAKQKMVTCYGSLCSNH
ncbi:hypothetical protein JOB18_035476 [Solea senegalensis]|uniref:Uncharacterized protein n=1 Tax=Solea senegalensis TaxID=28829 RepID=A0AAV6T998_SOLSE|nr:hypothetical protein JOB18_035476 [Solea senegalensis]KAG7526013.1 hypothetical protein JOB18_035476 [Solea senegalensis]